VHGIEANAPLVIVDRFGLSAGVFFQRHARQKIRRRFQRRMA
jgi:hypothetical protein